MEYVLNRLKRIKLRYGNVSTELSDANDMGQVKQLFESCWDQDPACKYYRKHFWVVLLTSGVTDSR